MEQYNSREQAEWLRNNPNNPRRISWRTIEDRILKGLLGLVVVSTLVATGISAYNYKPETPEQKEARLYRETGLTAEQRSAIVDSWKEPRTPKAYKKILKQATEPDSWGYEY